MWEPRGALKDSEAAGAAGLGGAFARRRGPAVPSSTPCAACELVEEIVAGPALSIAATKRVADVNDNDDPRRAADDVALALRHLVSSGPSPRA